MEDTKQRFEKGLIFYRSAAHGNGGFLLQEWEESDCYDCNERC